jgi:hypothetical protein
VCSSWGPTACRKVRFPMLEPYASKGARPVLRGGGDGNVTLSPDRRGKPKGGEIVSIDRVFLDNLLELG